MKSSFQLFKESFSELFTNIKTYLMLAGVSLVMAAVVAYIEPVQAEDGSFVWESTAQVYVYALSMFVSVVVGIVTTIAIAYHLENKVAPVAEALRMGVRYFLKNVAMSLLTLLIISIGLIFLILPGIWLAVSLMFGMYFIVLRGQGTIESLKSSFHLVKGRWWNTFGKLLFFGLLSLLLLIPILFFSFVIGMFTEGTVAYALESVLMSFVSILSLIFMYLLFRELENTQGVQEISRVQSSEAVATAV